MSSLDDDQAREMRIRDWEAGGYAVSYRRTVGAWWDELERDLLVRSLRPMRNARVLDAGSGVGRLSLALARAGYQVVAIDFSFRSLRFLRARLPAAVGPVMPVVATLTEPLPLADGSVDGVISGQVVQHIPTRELRTRAWRHLAQVARPGARLSTLVYKTYPGEPDEGHFTSGLFYHRYTAAELMSELRAGGWEPIRLSVWYRSRWPNVPAGLARRLETAAAMAHVAERCARYILATARRSAP